MTDFGDLRADAPIPSAGLASPPLTRHLLLEGSVQYAPGYGTGAAWMGEHGIPFQFADGPARIIHWDPALYARPGMTTRWQVDHTLITNAVNPNMDMFVGVLPVNSVGGGAGAVWPVAGAAIAASTISPRPTAGQVKSGGAQANAPGAAGFYGLGAAPTAVLAAGVYVLVSAQLWVVWA
jgi:hypothetical protein